MNDTEAFGHEVVERVRREQPDEPEEKEPGLMGKINQVVSAVRDFPARMNQVRTYHSHCKH